MTLETATFSSRCSLHEHALGMAIGTLESYGLLVARFGQENILPGWAVDELKRRTDGVATYLRFQPDLLVIGKSQGVWLAEGKSCAGRNQGTPNFSYELLSHETLMRLHEAGIPTFVIFDGVRAQWGWRLVFDRKFPDRQSNVQGSGTPFGLIRKASVPSLDDFIETELLQLVNLGGDYRGGG